MLPCDVILTGEAIAGGRTVTTGAGALGQEQITSAWRNIGALVSKFRCLSFHKKVQNKLYILTILIVQNV